MSNNFESSFSNPREKRAIAHNTIKRYKDGEATYEEAFKDAYDASHTKKGERSSFGKALGCLAVDAIAHCHDNDTIVVSGLSTKKQEEIAVLEATNDFYSYSPDAYMTRPNANFAPKLNDIIADPIADGFMPLDRTK